MPRAHQRSLIVLLVAGGCLVLASYLLAFAGTPELRGALWGGVPERLRGLYTVNMLLAAAGFFPMTWRVVFALDASELESRCRVPYRVFHALYALVLIPSALWLPMTASMIERPDPVLWWAIRGVLFAVGAGSTGLLGLLVLSALRTSGKGRWPAVAGALPFWTQTALLDATVWPAYYSW